MTKLQPTETILTGRWLVHAGQADSTTERIKWLISHCLQKIADSPQWGAWETLYKDPDDGRYWERTYPQGEMQGGGPPELRYLTAEEASQKYGSHFVKT
jgi:Immunity protein 27